MDSSAQPACGTLAMTAAHEGFEESAVETLRQHAQRLAAAPGL
jgi:hypothetical protein